MSQESRGDMTEFVSSNPAHVYNVSSLNSPQDFTRLQLGNSEVEFEDYFESGVDFGVDFGMIGTAVIHHSKWCSFHLVSSAVLVQFDSFVDPSCT